KTDRCAWHDQAAELWMVYFEQRPACEHMRIGHDLSQRPHGPTRYSLGVQHLEQRFLAVVHGFPSQLGIQLIHVLYPPAHRGEALVKEQICPPKDVEQTLPVVVAV